MIDKEKTNKDPFKSRILEYPSYYYDGRYDFKGLPDEEKLILVIVAYNLVDLCPNSRVFKSIFGFTDQYLGSLKKLIKHRIESVTIFSEDGCLIGKGYQMK